MSLRRTARVGDSWRNPSNSHIFTVVRVNKKGLKHRVIISDITGMFRADLSLRTYLSMIKGAEYITKSELKSLRGLIS